MLKHKIALSIVAVFLLGTIIGASLVLATLSPNTYTISAGIYPGAPSYTIWVEDGTYYAKNAYGYVEYSGTNALTAINIAITSAQNGTVFLKNGRYSISGEIQTRSVSIIGESQLGTVIQQTSTSANIIHAQGQIKVSLLTLIGSGWTNTNKAIYIDGDEANACTGGVFEDIKIYDCAIGAQMEDNSWNNHFHRVYMSKVKKGFVATRNSLAAELWNGENFISHDCWVSYDGANRIDYGYYIEKANAFIIELGQVLNPNIDGIFIKTFGEGLSIIKNTQVDACYRWALNVRNPTLTGWLECEGSFFKGGLSNSAVSSPDGINEVGGGVYMQNIWKSSILGGEVQSLVDGTETQAHHCIRLVNCAGEAEGIRIEGVLIYGNGASYDYAISLENSESCILGGFYAQNVKQVVVESGTSNRNRIYPFGSSGLNPALPSVVLVGVESQALYFDHLNENRLTCYGKFAISSDLYFKGSDFKFGASDKPGVVYDEDTDVIHFGYFTGPASVELHDLASFPDEELSGTPLIVKVWIGNTPYYFKIYPIKGGE